MAVPDLPLGRVGNCAPLGIGIKDMRALFFFLILKIE